MKVSDIDTSICRANYLRLKQEAEALGIVAPSDAWAPAAQLPVTHTLSYRRADRIFNRVSRDASGLYSRNHREGVVRTDGEDSGAGEVGLFDYVFAYHGIHQPWYARSDSGSGILYPVGIFIKRENETEDVLEQNATYRDLSADTIVPPWEQWFLETERARNLVPFDVAQHHNGSFWNYWGLPEDEDYDRDNHWKLLFEFHFRERVLADDFYGVVWPFRKTFTSTGYKVTRPVFPEIHEFLLAEFAETEIHQYVVPLRIEYNAVAVAFEDASFSAAQSILRSLVSN